MWDFPLFPPAASSVASMVDQLMFFLFAVSLFFALLVAILILVFSVKYHYTNPTPDRKDPPTFNFPLEIAWTAIPLGLVILMFLWSSRVFVRLRQPPANAQEMYVIGKQWMWKTQHPEGQREINALHVPIGQPIKLIMTSQDVIHSFYIPAFRIKQDVLPGRYTYEWFEATRPGRYHLFCAEYCGTSHSGMVGEIVAMTPADYQRWLSGAVTGSMASGGEKLFRQYGCMSCHRSDSLRRGPTLAGLFNQTVRLRGGQTAKADENYLRESILKPRAKVVEGFEPIMPTFEGQLTEEEVLQLIAYIKTLKGVP